MPFAWLSMRVGDIISFDSFCIRFCNPDINVFKMLVSDIKGSHCLLLCKWYSMQEGWWFWRLAHMFLWLKIKSTWEYGTLSWLEGSSFPVLKSVNFSFGYKCLSFFYASLASLSSSCWCKNLLGFGFFLAPLFPPAFVNPGSSSEK